MYSYRTGRIRKVITTELALDEAVSETSGGGAARSEREAARGRSEGEAAPLAVHRLPALVH